MLRLHDQERLIPQKTINFETRGSVFNQVLHTLGRLSFLSGGFRYAVINYTAMISYAFDLNGMHPWRELTVMKWCLLNVLEAWMSRMYSFDEAIKNMV